MTIDNKEIHPNQVPDIDVPTLQKAVSGGHMIVSGLGLYSYSSLFHIDFTHPVLKTDMINMEKQLTHVWSVFRKGKKIECFSLSSIVCQNISKISRCPKVVFIDLV